MQPVPWLAPTLPCRAPRARVVLVRRHALPREGKRQRLVVVMSLVLSYSWFYVCRLSLTYAGPAVVKQEGLDLRTLGAILSSGQISIGLSKIMSSVLTANWSPSRCLVLGMLLTAACNLLAAGAPAHGARLTLLLALVWAVNGLFQGTGKQRGLRQRHCLSGLGSPSCARIVSAWTSARERGFYWSPLGTQKLSRQVPYVVWLHFRLWNISNNLGGALAPLMVGLGAFAGWRGSLAVAGASTALVSLMVALLAQDSPQGQLHAVRKEVGC